MGPAAGAQQATGAQRLTGSDREAEAVRLLENATAEAVRMRRDAEANAREIMQDPVVWTVCCQVPCLCIFPCIVQLHVPPHILFQPLASEISHAPQQSMIYTNSVRLHIH